MRNQKFLRKGIVRNKDSGITLIALVVTIIILLILAGVTVSLVVGQNGLLQRAQTASNTMANATANELAQMGQYASDVDELTSGFIAGGGSEQGGSGETPVPSAPSVPTSKRASITPAPTGATYTEGQEVTFENERFFVISDDGTTVKLLAKYCLNRAGTEQLLEDDDWYGSDYAYYGYGRPFSKTAYWSSDLTISSNSPFDLQTESMISKARADGNVVIFNKLSADEDDEAPNAVVTAINYGTLKGVPSRLMTYSEAYTILSGTNIAMKNIMLGCWDDGTEPAYNYLEWWLGNADYDSSANDKVFMVTRISIWRGWKPRFVCG